MPAPCREPPGHEAALRGRRRATLTGAEFDRLRAHYDEAQVVEAMLLAGFYRTVSYLANGLALPLEAMAARFPD